MKQLSTVKALNGMLITYQERDIIGIHNEVSRKQLYLRLRQGLIPLHPDSYPQIRAWHKNIEP